EDAEDRFAVDLLLAFADLDVALEARGGVHQLRGGASVESEFVLDLDVALIHDRAPAAGLERGRLARTRRPSRPPSETLDGCGRGRPRSGFTTALPPRPGDRMQRGSPSSLFR